MAFLSLLRRVSCCCDKKIQFYKWILKKEETVLKDILKAGATETLTEEIKRKINGENWEECSDVADELIENNAALRYVETPAEQVNQPHLLLRVELHVWSSDVYITAVTCLCYSEQLDSDKTLVSHIVGPLSIHCQNFNCLKLFAEDSSSIWKTVTRGESICPSVL